MDKDTLETIHDAYRFYCSDISGGGMLLRNGKVKPAINFKDWQPDLKHIATITTVYEVKDCSGSVGHLSTSPLSPRATDEKYPSWTSQPLDLSGSTIQSLRSQPDQIVPCDDARCAQF